MDSFHDLETRSPYPLKSGTHRYIEGVEVLLWAYAGEEGEPRVWDVINGTDNWCDAAGVWHEEPQHWDGDVPEQLFQLLHGDNLVWFHNGGMFDFPVLRKTHPWFEELVPMHRWRDSCVQAFAHSMPGALEKLGIVLKLADEDKKKSSEGARLIRLFCIPQEDGTFYDKQSHPEDWQKFIEYAAQDIVTMRTAHRKLPMWNYQGKQIDLWLANLRMNYRGFAIDQELAEKAIAAATAAKAGMAGEVQRITHDAVGAATQRDALLKYICEAYGVELPDMQADTLERRLEDPDLPPEVKELIGLRLRASMNSPAKYRAVLKGVNADGRMRGCEQFRGAGRTGRTGHRNFQPGNLPRPAYPWQHVKALVRAIKLGLLEMVCDNTMQACASMIRCVIVAPPGKKLVVADLANIEGRTGAWLAGEDHKLEAYRLYDQGLGKDLYIVAYCKAFNVPIDEWDGDKAKRQIGKVQELMLQYQGGVGAWITGAATYGIDLDAMTEATFDSLPEWAVSEAWDFLKWLDDMALAERDEKLRKTVEKKPIMSEAEFKELVVSLDNKLAAKKVKIRFGLKDKTWVTCDALKRLWRRDHPAIVSYWKVLENAVLKAIDEPGVSVKARKVVIRRDGSWLRIRLPSGRYLCYPNIHVTADGKIAYTGQNTYTRAWGEVKTYGGKLFENIVQAVANDQLVECHEAIETAGYLPVLTVHDEYVTETPDTEDFTAKKLAEMMCADLGWNEGLPLAAAGYETDAYHKED
jgi:DNA polymerase